MYITKEKHRKVRERPSTIANITQTPKQYPLQQPPVNSGLFWCLKLWSRLWRFNFCRSRLFCTTVIPVPTMTVKRGKDVYLACCRVFHSDLNALGTPEEIPAEDQRWLKRNNSTRYSWIFEGHCLLPSFQFQYLQPEYSSTRRACWEYSLVSRKYRYDISDASGGKRRPRLTFV